MSIFDSFRYYLALVILLTCPGAPLFWFPIHPFVAFWRRVGYRWAYVAGFGVFGAVGLFLWIWREPLLAIEFGVNPFVLTVGVALALLSTVMRRLWHRQLAVKTLFGAPELAPDRYPGRLLTEGFYARVRHPRYLEIIVGFLGWALVSNYLAAYLTWAFVAATIALLIPIEERELVERFGAEYEAYRRQVPALVPRIRK